MSDQILEEMRLRLINIETKINQLMETAPRQDFLGHADQAFGHITYAQHGEDLIIANLFDLAGISRPSYIDIGAHHPLNISNTALLHKRGSRGINVEANPNLFAAFKELRPDDTNLNCGVGPEAGSMDFYFIDDWSGRNTFAKEQAEAFVASYPDFAVTKVVPITVRTLDEIIATEAGGRWPDFLSIDVEGWDFAILEPSKIAVANGPKVICVQVVTAGSAAGNEAIHRLLIERGYQPYVRTIGNAIFIEPQMLRQLRIPRLAEPTVIFNERQLEATDAPAGRTNDFVRSPNPKRPLAFMLAISENLGFAAGNVAIALNRHMQTDELDIVIFYRTLAPMDRAALLRIRRVRLVPFEFPTGFAAAILDNAPPTSRFKNQDSLMAFCHFEAFGLLEQYRTVVWLDADTSVQSSLAGIEEFGPLAITSDRPWTVQVNFSRPLSGYRMDLPGWCSAVMVLQDSLPFASLRQWCYNAAMAHAESLVNADQGIINLALQEFGISPYELACEEWQCICWRQEAALARVVHFGTDRKVWADPNVLAAFPEWLRVHREWLKLGGRDFDHGGYSPRSLLAALDDLDKKSTP